MVPTSSPKDVERFLRKYGRNEVSHSHAKSSSGARRLGLRQFSRGSFLPKFG